MPAGIQVPDTCDADEDNHPAENLRAFRRELRNPNRILVPRGADDTHSCVTVRRVDEETWRGETERGGGQSHCAPKPCGVAEFHDAGHSPHTLRSTVRPTASLKHLFHNSSSLTQTWRWTERSGNKISLSFPMFPAPTTTSQSPSLMPHSPPPPPGNQCLDFTTAVGDASVPASGAWTVRGTLWPSRHIDMKKLFGRQTSVRCESNTRAFTHVPSSVRNRWQRVSMCDANVDVSRRVLSSSFFLAPTSRS